MCAHAFSHRRNSPSLGSAATDARHSIGLLLMTRTVYGGCFMMAACEKPWAEVHGLRTWRDEGTRCWPCVLQN